MKGQNLLIHTYLQKGNKLTQNEALSLFGVGRLASRINDLKEMGHPIHAEMITVKNRSGKDVRIAQYSLVQKGQTTLF